MKISEEDIVIESKRILLNNTSIKVAREVPMLGRSIDLVVKKGRTIISIEFKLNDWRKGLKQARDYMLASDYSYICLPENRKISNELLTTAKLIGVGVYVFSPNEHWPFVEVLKAKRSAIMWKFARDEINKSLKNGSEQRSL